MMKLTVKSDFSKIEKLAARLEKNLYKRAVRAGAKLCVADLRNRVPLVSGALKKSIAAKVDSPKGQTSAYAVIGPRSKYVFAKGGVKKQPARYFHFIDSGKFAKPVLYPVMAAGERNYIQAMEDVISQEINKVLNG
jgi:hypothetical protein